MVMVNSFPVALWQTTQIAVGWGPTRSPVAWLVPGGPAGGGPGRGFPAGGRRGPAAGEGLLRWLAGVAPWAWHGVHALMSCGTPTRVPVEPVQVPPAQSASVVHWTEAIGPPTHALT